MPRKILDISLLGLQGAENGLLSEDSLKALEEHCKDLCAKHLSLDRKDIIILRQGVSPYKKLSPSKREYAVACSLTSEGLLSFTLHYRKSEGLNITESLPERASDRYKKFSVFFRASTAADLKNESAPRIVIMPKEECHGTCAL